MDFKGKYQFSTSRGGQGGSGSDTNKVWLKDVELAQNTKMLAGVQRSLFEKQKKTVGTAGDVEASKDPKKRWSYY